MSYGYSTTLVYSLSLFVGILAALVIGHAAGVRSARHDADGARAGFGAVEGAVFGLMGLLIAFTFSGAASRFDARRELIVQEANAIGTAWLRLDLLEAEPQPAIRESFRSYFDGRLAVYRNIDDLAAAWEAVAETQRRADRLWSQAVEAARVATMPQAATLLLPALNEMFDIATTRTMATEMHPPSAIFEMLFGFTVVAALFAGVAMAGGKRRSWLHIVGFSLVMAISVYVILDLEFPRRGLIRTDSFDSVLLRLRASLD